MVTMPAVQVDNAVQTFQNMLRDYPDQTSEIKHAIKLLDFLHEELLSMTEVTFKYLKRDDAPGICLAAMYELGGERSNKILAQAWKQYRTERMINNGN